MPGQDERDNADNLAQQRMLGESDGEPAPAQDGGWPFAWVLFFSALLWPFAAIFLWQRFPTQSGFDETLLALLLVPSVCILAPAAALLYRRRWLAALAALALLPIAAFAYLALTLALVTLFDVFGMRQGLVPTQYVMLADVAIPAAVGLVLAFRYCRRVVRAEPRGAPTRFRWKKTIGLCLMFVVVLILSMKLLRDNTEREASGYVRVRVSELILAGSSAKTALSEGMQTYGTWSADWMSSITISATGMVSSASIGPAGVITVYGTALTSDSVVTMIPSTTTDNKLVWSCTGHPARYMPASCR